LFAAEALRDFARNVASRRLWEAPLQRVNDREQVPGVAVDNHEAACGLPMAISKFSGCISIGRISMSTDKQRVAAIPALIGFSYSNRGWAPTDPVGSSLTHRISLPKSTKR
jgi:hypothetical protein